MACGCYLGNKSYLKLVWEKDKNNNVNGPNTSFHVWLYIKIMSFQNTQLVSQQKSNFLKIAIVWLSVHIIFFRTNKRKHIKELLRHSRWNKSQLDKYSPQQISHISIDRSMIDMWLNWELMTSYMIPALKVGTLQTHI